MAKIVVDPVTRIEGHLRIEAEVKGGKITNAWSSSTMFRGIENILLGRDPREAWTFAQRICGVCTTVHAIASVRAVENALGIVIPDNARIIRNIIIGSQNIQDHIIHFYHLQALDWVDVVSALKADPAKTSKLAQSISNWPKSSTKYFKGIQDKIAKFVKSGQLGIFANAYWGHPEYKLPPEANLMGVAHYLEALDIQREYIRVHALLGGKNPHLQTFLVGGMASPVDPNSENALNADSIALLMKLQTMVKKFVDEVYVPDILAIAPFYLEWASLGEGIGNFLCYGDFPDTYGNPWFPPGIVLNRDLTKVYPIDEKKITEYVSHSWYKYKDESKGLRPIDGITDPNYTGPKPPYEYLNTNDKYSWLKAPRYDDKPMEVGPLARLIVGYAAGQKDITKEVNDFLGKLKLSPKVLFSTLGRTAARALECKLMAKKTFEWINELAANMKKGELETFDPKLWNPDSWPKEATGHAFHEAPRGSLGHWIKIKNKKIENYQAVVPTTWNGSPRDAKGQKGPFEASLIGTPIANAKKPLEILRTIHSFDPCLACAVHVYNGKAEEICQVKVV